jgi:hypothetical protein
VGAIGDVDAVIGEVDLERVAATGRAPTGAHGRIGVWGRLVVICSTGIPAGWSIDRELASRAPQVIAGALYRDLPPGSGSAIVVVRARAARAQLC